MSFHPPPLAIQWNGSLKRGQSQAMEYMDQLIREPLYIDEIVITMSSATITPFIVPKLQNWMDSARLTFKVGAQPVTTGRNGVGVSMLAPNMFANEVCYVNMSSSPSGNNGLTPPPGDYTYPEISYNWRLPKPLFVPPGARLYVGLTTVDDALPPIIIDDVDYYAGFNFWVTMLCRRHNSALPMPSVVHVPFAAQYVTKGHTVSEDRWVETSQDIDLANTFKQPVHLDRMIGTVSTQYTPTEVVDAHVRIADKAGAFIVREYTPVAELFSGFHKSLTLEGCVMPPDDFYTVEFVVQNATQLLVGQDAHSDIYTANSQLIGNFSLIGYRDMPLNEVYPDLKPMPMGSPATDLPALATPSQPIATDPLPVPVQEALNQKLRR